uniref:Bee-milk protein n=1 Tax=Sipha flava TaxID=143950 RepID=A0A2S2QPS7_9HEMI
MRPMRSAALCVVVSTAVAAMVWSWSARAANTAAAGPSAARTQVKWLINTGHLAGRWPPRSPANRTSARRAPAAAVAPNAISRFQMVDGGTVAVLVMPTGDGGHRCCGRGWTSHFSLGFVRLRHGFNNLYPTVQPFPDWSAFVDAAGPPPEPVRNGPRPRRAADESSDSSECVPEVTTKSSPEPHIDTYGGRNRQRIVNAVDAFLDDRGRILWVLDTGDEDACDSDTDDPSPPKFLAIDLHTNQVRV